MQPGSSLHSPRDTGQARVLQQDGIHAVLPGGEPADRGLHAGHARQPGRGPGIVRGRPRKPARGTGGPGEPARGTGGSRELQGGGRVPGACRSARHAPALRGQQSPSAACVCCSLLRPRGAAEAPEQVHSGTEPAWWAHRWPVESAGLLQCLVWRAVGLTAQPCSKVPVCSSRGGVWQTMAFVITGGVTGPPHVGTSGCLAQWMASGPMPDQRTGTSSASLAMPLPALLLARAGETLSP